jgi:hypothetical protein
LHAGFDFRITALAQEIFHNAGHTPQGAGGILFSPFTSLSRF